MCAECQAPSITSSSPATYTVQKNYETARYRGTILHADDQLNELIYTAQQTGIDA